MIFLNGVNRMVPQDWTEDFRSIEAIYDFFSSLGIPNVPLSRIKAYKDAFLRLEDAAQGKRPLDLDAAHKIIGTLVPFGQLRTITRAAQTSKQAQAWQKQIRALVSGSPFFKSENAARPNAHDFQFECFIAAVFELSGYKIGFGEPDVIIECDQYKVAIAAKRPRNIGSIERNCKKAIEQIRRSGLPGIIALDLSEAIYPANYIKVPDDSIPQTFLKQIVINFVSIYGDKLKETCRNNLVFAVLLQVHLPALNVGEKKLGIPPSQAILWDFFIVCNKDDERVNWAIDCAAKCEIGLFGPRAAEQKDA